MISVNNGVIEFNTPARALSILVWALVNKNAGIVDPTNPTTNKARKFSRVNFLKNLILNGKKAKKDINILNAAT